jgi:hypothetical protein
MAKGRVVTVDCQGGQRLFKYYKGGRGRLIACYLDEIRQDYVGIDAEPTGSQPVCPGCGKELGSVRIIRGRPALKINQGTIQQIRI